MSRNCPRQPHWQVLKIRRTGPSILPSRFDNLQQRLLAWTDLPIETVDYVRAAEHFNSCRSRGVQGTHTDFLICAIAERHELAILTTDQDFSSYAEIIPVKLLIKP